MLVVIEVNPVLVVVESKRSIPGNNKRILSLKVKASDFYLSFTNEK